MANGDGGGGGRVVLVVVLVLFGLALVCCGGVWLAGDSILATLHEQFAGGIMGSGQVAREVRDVAPFDRVLVVGAADALVTVGPEQSVVVEADDNILPVVTTTVRDGVLEVSSSESYSTTLGVTVLISVPALAGVSVVGAGDVDARGVDAASFEVQLTGSGDVRATGRTESLTVRLTGAGDAELFELRARDARVSVTGTGDVDVHASRSLEASVNGTGDVTYDGDPPDVTQRVEGPGDVRPRAE